jgi:DUF4097 and DUF4098 domain-containing protein YvlB
MSVRDKDVEVDFTVRAPHGVEFVGSYVNGDVEAVNLAGPVEANTVNGGVRVETSAGDASARTVNGGVSLTLPRDVDADLEAETVNGSISTDFPITVVGRMSPRRLYGRIGDGGRPLRIRTANGSIRIRSGT